MKEGIGTGVWIEDEDAGLLPFAWLFRVWKDGRRDMVVEVGGRL